MPYQRPPVYYGYWRYKNGGYADITECSSCGTISLYEDAHPVNPCNLCGGRVSTCGDAGMWIAPTYTGYLWWKKEVTAGFWQRPTEA